MVPEKVKKRRKKEKGWTGRSGAGRYESGMQQLEQGRAGQQLREEREKQPAVTT